jgi:hypothetical protein
VFYVFFSFMWFVLSLISNSLKPKSVNQWVFRYSKKTKKFRSTFVWVPLIVSKSLFLKYRRQFCINNLVLFPNHPNHFYIFSLSSIFILATHFLSLVYLHWKPCPYSLFFSTSFHLQISWSIGHAYIYAWLGRFYQARKEWGWDRELLEGSFFNLAKNNQDWERILETLGDALMQINLWPDLGPV